MKTVMIAGAWGGIGRAVSHTFHQAGHNVALVSRQVEKLQQLASELGGERTLILPADLSNPEQVAAVFSDTIREFSQLDAVIISVGKWDQLAATDSIARASELFRVHFDGMQLPSQLTAFAAAKFLKPQGLLAVISSHVAAKHLPDNLSYGSAKTGMEKFLADFGQDLLQTNLGPIRISVLRPWTVNTPENLAYINRRGFDPAKAVQPQAIANWLLQNLDNLSIPPFKEFKADFEL